MELLPGNSAYFENSAYSCFEVDVDKCNKCGDCIEMCPMDVLRFDQQGFPGMYYANDCWYCDTCIFVCPRQACKMDSLPYLIRQKAGC